MKQIIRKRPIRKGNDTIIVLKKKINEAQKAQAHMASCNLELMRKIDRLESMIRHTKIVLKAVLDFPNNAWPLDEARNLLRLIEKHDKKAHKDDI